MARGSTAKTSIEIVANAKGVNAGLSQAEKRIAKFGKNVKSSGSMASGAFSSIGNSVGGAASALTGIGVGLSFVGIAAGLKSTIDRLDELGDKAKALHDTAENLSELDYIGKRMGVNLEDGLGPALDKFVINLGKAATTGGDTAKMIEALGLNIDELLKLKPTEAFITVASAIGDIQNPFERAGAAAAVFGKQAKDLMAMFDDPSQIQAFAEDFEKLHPDINKAADAAGKVADQIDRVNEAAKGVGESLITAFGPKLESMLKTAADLLGKINDETSPQHAAAKGFISSIAEAIGSVLNNSTTANLVKDYMGENSGMKYDPTKLVGPSKATQDIIKGKNLEEYGMAKTHERVQNAMDRFDDDSVASDDNTEKIIAGKETRADRIRAAAERASKAGERAQDAMDRAQHNFVYKDWLAKKNGASASAASMDDSAANGGSIAPGEIADYLDEITKKQEEEKKTQEKAAEYAKQLGEDTQTPIEKYHNELEKIQELYDAGMIDQKTYFRAGKQGWDEYIQKMKQVGAEQKKAMGVNGIGNTGYSRAQQHMIDQVNAIADFSEPRGGFVGGNVPANFRYFTDPATSAAQGGRSSYSAQDFSAMTNQAYSAPDPQMDENNQWLKVIAENTANSGMVG